MAFPGPAARWRFQVRQLCVAVDVKFTFYHPILFMQY